MNTTERKVRKLVRQVRSLHKTSKLQGSTPDKWNQDWNFGAKDKTVQYSLSLQLLGEETNS